MNVLKLREILAEEIEKVRDKKSSASQVNAVTNAAGKMLASAKLELEYCKQLGKTPQITFLE